MKEKYSLIPSPTGMSEILYKHTEQESLVTVIVYQSDCKNIWSVKIEKLINTQGGKFYISDKENPNEISKEKYEKKLQEAINFLKS